MAKRDKYNSSGCLDLTAYNALQKIERDEAGLNRHQREKERIRKRREQRLRKKRSKKR